MPPGTDCATMHDFLFIFVPIRPRKAPPARPVPGWPDVPAAPVDR
jgi:hypothetical protein